MRYKIAQRKRVLIFSCFALNLCYISCVYYNVVRHIRETRNEKEIENDIPTTDIDTKLFLR